MNLNNSKASQDSDISVRINIDNLDTFKKILYQEKSRFPSFRKATNITPVFKKGDRIRQTRDLLVYCQTCQKF